MGRIPGLFTTLVTAWYQATPALDVPVMEECPNLPPNFAILPFEPLVICMRQRMSRSRGLIHLVRGSSPLRVTVFFNVAN
jgi:hypothetical protein